MAKTRTLSYQGPPDHFLVKLQRTVQPGDELKLTDEELGDGEADAVADALLCAYGFTEGKATAKKGSD